jgi:hypothetical protein
LLIAFPNPIPFHPIWGNDSSKSLEKERFINSGLSLCMEFWKFRMCKGETYVKKLGPYVDYLENILELLSKLLPTQSSTLLEGF